MSTTPTQLGPTQLGPPARRAGAEPGIPATDVPRPVRVILVGRTGLDAILRLDRGIELVRARTPLAAIGELADPIDSTTADAATVIVGPDAVPADRARAFVDALRRVGPRTRVLAIGRAVPAAYDGPIPPDADPEAARRLVRLGFETAEAARHRTADDHADTARVLDALLAGRAEEPPPRRHRPITASAAEAPAMEPLADDPARAVAEGGDGVAAALEIARAALGPTARFVAGPLPEADAATPHAPVEFNGRRLGSLLAPDADPAAARREADRLAPWVVLAAQHDQLRRAAFTDELTGAWNRRYFNRFLTAALEHARAHRHAVTLLVFDVDDFKKYNDRYGHAAGDEILVETVRLLTSVIRPTDRVCRVGGDEFAVVFHDPEGPRDPASLAKGPAPIAQIAQRFQKQICSHNFPKLLDQAPGTLTISGGMATFPWDGQTAQELLDRADQLAMHSKRQGKNVITFGPGAEHVCGVGY